MAVTEKELLRLIDVEKNPSKKSKLSYDGKNLLTRIPQEVVNTFRLKKGQSIEWSFDDKMDLRIKVVG